MEHRLNMNEGRRRSQADEEPEGRPVCITNLFF